MPPDPTDFAHADIPVTRTGRTRGRNPSLYGKVYGDLDTRTRSLEKRVDGEWVYVGTYPSDDLTTPDSPPFQNNWENVEDGKLGLRFRWTLSGKIEIEGVITGGTVGTVIFTLPEKFWPDEEYKVPYYADDSAPSVLCVETDGDVVFCSKAGIAGGIGDPIPFLQSLGGLLGYWPLGDSAPGDSTDNIDTDFGFNQAAFPTAPAGDLMVTTGGGPAGNGFMMRTHGNGPAILDPYDKTTTPSEDGSAGEGGLSGDGACLFLQGSPRLQASLNPGYVFAGGSGDRQPFSYGFWFAPGYRDPEMSGGTVIYSNTATGFVFGDLFMDGSGSENEGQGFVWNPETGTLQYWYIGPNGVSGDEVNRFTYPIASLGQYIPGQEALLEPDNSVWWTDRGFRNQVGPIGSAFTDPDARLKLGGDDVWHHVGVSASYPSGSSGAMLELYYNGSRFAQHVLDYSTGFGTTFYGMRGEIDFGVSSYWQGGDCAASELVVFDRRLTPAEWASVYRLNQGTEPGSDQIPAASVLNTIGDTITAHYAIQQGETFILCDSSGGGFTVTLPTNMVGIPITIKKKSGTNTVTIDAPGSTSIDGALTYSLTAAYASVTLMATESEWLTLD